MSLTTTQHDILNRFANGVHCPRTGRVPATVVDAHLKAQEAGHG